MAVKLRLTRIGRKRLPHYRIVAVDSRNARDGKSLEILGTYSPISEQPVKSLKPERIRYWLDNGAQASDKVRSILKRALEGV
ncbi:MAG TPA: 30S ribosomal protein S16 [Atribacteraceae bacterium]|nr:30S ribosomal protein S16 [Atribacteraceae bacterium]